MIKWFLIGGAAFLLIYWLLKIRASKGGDGGSMMTGIVGERGAGKTHFLSKLIHQKRAEGYYIITNFTHADSNKDCSHYSPTEFYELLRELAEFKDAGYEMVDLFPSFYHTGVFIAIDEIQLYFNQDFKYEDAELQYVLLKLLAQARKLDVQIVFVAQQPDKVNKDFRRFTDVWINVKPMFTFLRSRKPYPHPTRPCVQYEIRYMVPISKLEYHSLDANNPQFNYTVIRDELGSSWSPKSTVKSTGYTMSGWLDPLPYKLYSSNQALALKPKDGQEFSRLRSFSLVEPIPAIRLLRLKVRLGIIKNVPAEIPTRYIVDPELVKLPPIERKSDDKNIISQPSKRITSLRELYDTPFGRYIKNFSPSKS